VKRQRQAAQPQIRNDRSMVSGYLLGIAPGRRVKRIPTRVCRTGLRNPLEFFRGANIVMQSGPAAHAQAGIIPAESPDAAVGQSA
jgi:hypothetical protein